MGTSTRRQLIHNGAELRCVGLDPFGSRRPAFLPEEAPPPAAQQVDGGGPTKGGLPRLLVARSKQGRAKAPEPGKGAS
eukprot:850921-Alexandrium_andersonii.AAC.1